jgi:hypothetical protein
MKALPIFLLLIALTGCCRSYQRFVSVPEGFYALDTKTGRACNPFPNDPKNFPEFASRLPLCYDLYKGKE